MPRGPRGRVTPTNPLWAKVFAERYRRFPPESITDEFVDNSRRMYYAGISLVDQKVGEILGVAGGARRARLDLGALQLGPRRADGRPRPVRQDALLPCVGRRAVHRAAAARRAGAARPSSAPTEAIDLAATILDIAGAEPLDAPGRSLLPVMRGEETPRYAFSEMARSKDTFFVAVTDGRWRYTVEQRSKTPCELFDLAERPAGGGEPGRATRHTPSGSPRCRAT